MAKRIHTPKAKPGELKACWGRSEPYQSPSLVYAHGGEGAGRADSYVLASAFEEVRVFDGRTLAQILDDRGYDLTTLKFSIQKKQSDENS